MQTRRGLVDPDLRLMEEVAEDELIGGSELGFLHEDYGTAMIGDRGTRSPIRADGTMKVVIIRPCISRGKKLRGLPPIYTPDMLRECAGVFSGWPMFMDHLTEEIQEALRKRGRSVNELGGRLLESWWDGAFTHPEDSKFGFQQGAVLGYALPQPGSRAMIEADPEILRLSINAWPTGARRGRAPWNAQEGMLIEGIGDEPPGSVDFVIRAGAGGRVLQETEQLAVSIIERAYSAAHEAAEHHSEGEMNIEGKSPAEIVEMLREEHADVADLLINEGREQAKPPPASGGDGGNGGGTPLTEERLVELLSEHRSGTLDEVKTLLEEHEEEEDQRVTEQIEQRDLSRALAAEAHRLIEGAENLTPKWREELKAAYVVLPSGPCRKLQLIEHADDETDPMDRLRESVNADVERAVELINDTKPKPKPNGLGGGGSLRESEEEDGGGGEELSESVQDNEFVGYLVESGFGSDVESAVKKMREAVTG